VGEGKTGGKGPEKAGQGGVEVDKSCAFGRGRGVYGGKKRRKGPLS